MKYKHIYSAVRNFGASYTSLLNFTQDGYVMDELTQIHDQGFDITIDWLAGTFEPAALESARIIASIRGWRSGLERHLASEKVNLSAIRELDLRWPTAGRIHMRALDDRGTEHIAYLDEWWSRTV